MILLIVISENIFSKYIESDNIKIQLRLKKLYLIYSKSIKRKKLKYFFKFRNNIFLSYLRNIKENKEKRRLSYNNSEVYDRLFNYSIIKEKMLYNLSNKYLIDEEGKYTFIPQINSRDSNFYINHQNLYEIPHRDIQFYSERNNLRRKTINKIKNLKNNLQTYNTSYIKNKYIPIQKYKNNTKQNSNNSISFFKNNTYCSDINNRSYNEKCPMKNKNKLYSGNLFTNSNKFNSNSLNNNNFYTVEEEKENGKKTSLTNNRTLYLNKNMNKSYANKIYPFDSIINKENQDNNSFTVDKIPFSTNINKISRNSDLHIYLKNRLKNNKKENPKEIKITKRNGNNVEHQKKFIHSNYSSSSIYNISSIGGSLLKDNIKLKSQHSPDKKEHLFSFGSDLFYVDNKNPNHVRIKSNNKNKNLIQRNNNLKISSHSIRSQIPQVSTKSSGTNTNSYYTNYKLNGNKEKIKNGSEKKSVFEMQSINEYSIINDFNSLESELLNLQTSLQTLTDSKILDLANKYISDDDSLEGYKRKIGIDNKNINKKEI